MNYFLSIFQTISTLVIGMSVTLGHMLKIRKGNVTLQYPVERLSLIHI